MKAQGLEGNSTHVHQRALFAVTSLSFCRLVFNATTNIQRSFGVLSVLDVAVDIVDHMGSQPGACGAVRASDGG
jgi:hypothetical protein